MNIPVGIPSHKRGDTWGGMELIATTTDENGVVIPVDLTNVDIISQFKTSIDDSVVFEFKKQDGSIIVPNPVLGRFLFAPKKMDYPAKRYFFDVQLTYLGGDVETIVPTHTWDLVQDVSM